ncbi:MAG TPA: response regulator [Segetibacter sp.]
MDNELDRKEISIQSLNPLRESSKRATQFCCVAIGVASITIVTNIIDGNLVSASLIAGVVLSLILMTWINIKGYPFITKYSIIILLNVFLVLIAFAEGLNSASTFYFLPLLFAIPFFVDNNKNHKLHLSIFFLITLSSFVFCIAFCDKTSTWQQINERTFHKMYITNSFGSFVLCAIFGSLNIYLERRYANALLVQMTATEEAMHARTKFLSNMGHELRTPLNGIIGATNLLRNHESLPEQKDFLNILKYCSDHMLGLVNDILDFNKIEAGQLDLHPVECNIKKLLTQSTLPFYNSFEEKKLALKLVIDERLNEIVLLDDLRLLQVINNLLSNALKFIETGFVKLEAILKQRIDNELTIHFSVIDTGIGIKSANQQKIFVSFWQVYNETTRKYEGTGLGLTICQRLLKMMNSALMVESEEGKGSNFNFTITVPVVSSVEEKIVDPVSTSNNLEGIRILLAEDNIINMMIAKKFLEDKKAVLTTAENGEEALKYLENNGHYDLILLDLEMPVMDGYTAIVEITKRYKDIPVLAFTAALMDQEMLNKLLSLGFLDCILKPFQPLDLYAKVRKYAKPLAKEKALRL